jgi:hypothetical protein
MAMVFWVLHVIRVLAKHVSGVFFWRFGSYPLGAQIHHLSTYGLLFYYCNSLKTNTALPIKPRMISFVSAHSVGICTFPAYYCGDPSLSDNIRLPRQPPTTTTRRCMVLR